jgi:hypothetical protein
MNATTWRNYLLLAALGAQVPHAAGLFHRLAPAASGYWELAGWGHALLYAIAVEGAVYYFVLEGKKKYSWGFAFAGVLTNLLYYWQEGNMSALYIGRGALISIILPFAIALYSHADAEDAQGETTEAHAIAIETAPAAPAIQVSAIAPAPPAQSEAPTPIKESTLAPKPRMIAQPAPTLLAVLTAQEAQSETPKTAPDPQPESAKSRVFALLDANPDDSPAAIAAQLGISAGAVRAYRSEWRKAQSRPQLAMVAD